VQADPNNLRAAELLGTLYLYVWDLDAFVAERRRRVSGLADADTSKAATERWCLALLKVARSGNKREVLRFLLEGLATNTSSRASVQRAGLFAALGDTESAFRSLDHAIALRDPWLVYLAVAPLWDRLREDARFTDRLRMMQLPSGASSGSPALSSHG